MADKHILQVKENKNGQKRVTIPKKSEISDGDYVEVRKCIVDSISIVLKGGKNENEEDKS